MSGRTVGGWLGWAKAVSIMCTNVFSTSSDEGFSNSVGTPFGDSLDFRLAAIGLLPKTIGYKPLSERANL